MGVLEVTVISLAVLLFPFLWAGIHFRKYGYIQGFISLVTMPVVTDGIGKLLIIIFKNNSEVLEILNSVFGGLTTIVDVYRRLMTFTEVKWLYDTDWFYMPFVVLLILTWGFSMTLRRKKAKNKKVKSQNI